MFKILTLVFFLAFQMTFSQSVNHFDLDPKHTVRKINEFNSLPALYAVVEKEYVFNYEPVSEKFHNNAYAEINKEINYLVKDSVQKENVFNGELEKFTEVMKIKTLINEFLGSKEAYEFKKNKLVTAQNIASKYKLNHLIYADDNINTNYKSKFFMLKLNNLDMKVHLKRIVWDLEKINLVSPVKNSSETINGRLKQLRKKKKAIGPYNVIITNKEPKYKTSLTTATKVDVKNFKGKFQHLGVYYTIKNNYKDMFKKGMLVDSKTAKEYNLINKGYTGVAKQMLLETTNNKKFVSPINFIEQYAFSINGKFNARGSSLVTANFNKRRNIQ